MQYESEDSFEVILWLKSIVYYSDGIENQTGIGSLKAYFLKFTYQININLCIISFILNCY